MRHALISYDLFKVKAWLCIAAAIFAIYFLVWWFSLRPKTSETEGTTTRSGSAQER